MNHEDDILEAARKHAEGVQEKLLNQMGEHLMGMLKYEPVLLKKIWALLAQDNTEAVEVITAIDPKARRALLLWIVPMARIGMAAGLMRMQDNHTGG